MPETSVRIRRARPGEGRLLAEFEAKLAAHDDVALSRSVTEMAAERDELLSTSWSLGDNLPMVSLVAEVRRVPVGTAMVMAVPAPVAALPPMSSDDDYVEAFAAGRGTPPEALLADVWVDEGARHHGAGGGLVDAALSWAGSLANRLRGVRAASLWVSDADVAAQGLYTSRGFVATGEVATYPGVLRPPHETRRMVRTLG